MIKNPARKDGTTASQAYTRHFEDIHRLIDVLEMELQKHADNQKADYKNWGLVGDLGKVRRDLIEAVAFISGNPDDTKMVEEFLEEARS